MTKFVTFFKKILSKAARINDHNMADGCFWGWSYGHLGTLLHNLKHTLNTKTYDNLVRQRFFTPAVDPDILIIDIDEASLAHTAIC